MLIRKVPFIHSFKSFTFWKMLSTPGKARQIKYPYLTRGKKVLIFEIKSADRREWSRWYLDMSVGDEMRAQKITFILCIVLSLKTSLNPMLPGERRLAWLGIKSHLFLTVWWVFLWNFDILKPVFDPGRTDHTHMPKEHMENVQNKKKKVWWEKFYVVNSMCPILSSWCRAGGGRVKMHFLYWSIN